MANLSSPKLLFAEHDFQVDDLLARFPESDSEWGALGPSAQYALRAKGIPHRIPEEFHSPKELSDLCLATREKLKKMCRFLDARFLKDHPALESAGVTPFLFYIYSLAILFDGLESRIFKLRKTFEAYPRHTPVLHQTPVDCGGLVALGFSARESVWGHVAALAGWDRNIELVPYPLPNTSSGTSLKSVVKSASDGSILLYSAAQTLREKGVSGLPRLLNPKKKPSLLLFGNRVEWRETLPFFDAEGLRVFSASESGLAGSRGKTPPPSNAFGGFLENNAEVRSTCRAGAVDFFPFLKDRLCRIGTESAADFEKSLERLRSLKERKGLKAVLTTSAAGGRHHLILRAAQSLRLPVLLWQHGFVGYDERINQLYDFSDRMTSDVTLVYGDGSREAYASHGESFGSALTVVGSAQLESLIPPAANHPRRRILYATTVYYGNYWYFGMQPGWSDNLFYRDQETILTALEKIRGDTGVEIVVKLHPTREFPPPPWAEKIAGREGWTIVRDESSFTDLARDADAVVLDCPSTTLLQALSLDARVFALMGHWTYHPEILALLKKRAVCEDSADALMRRAGEFLRTRDYPADLGNAEFLRKFGTCNESTAAARKTSEAVLASFRRESSN